MSVNAYMCGQQGSRLTLGSPQPKRLPRPACTTRIRIRQIADSAAVRCDKACNPPHSHFCRMIPHVCIPGRYYGPYLSCVSAVAASVCLWRLGSPAVSQKAFRLPCWQVGRSHHRRVTNKRALLDSRSVCTQSPERSGSQGLRARRCLQTPIATRNSFGSVSVVV